MSRDLDSLLQAESEASTLMPVYLAAFDFSGGYVRAWTGYGDLVFDGATYQGVGTFGGISEIKESTMLSAEGVRFTLSGIPSDLLSIVLGERYSGRMCYLFLGAFKDGALVGTPHLMFSGRMDVATIVDGAESGTIEMTAESRLIDFENPRVRRFTDEDQRIDYPDDDGLEYLAAIQDNPVPWGASNKEAPFLRK